MTRIAPRSMMQWRWLLLICALTLGACSPLYVMRAAYEQSKILAGRTKIENLLEDPAVPPKDKAKLQLALDTRAFVRTIGLEPKGAFSKYSKVDRDVLVWVVSASRKDAFALAGWWFPFVGTVPYKGFFELEDAKEEGKGLEERGLEVWIRGSEAFSTLGWFDDPLLSTTLKHAPSNIANTIIHESVHTTIWIPNRVDFNESLAQFVGNEASIDFFTRRQAACGVGDPECTKRESMNVASAEREKERDLALSHTLETLYQDLTTLYGSELSSEEKTRQRVPIFESGTRSLIERYPEIQVLRSINNAEILQLRLYLAGYNKFGATLASVNRDWHAFLTQIAGIKQKVEETPGTDPFTLLRQ